MSSFESSEPIADPSVAALVSAQSVADQIAGPGGPSAIGDDQGDAALVELSGASAITVEEYQQSVPPTLAVAAALVSEVADLSDANTAAHSALYTLLDHADVFALAAG